MSMNGGEIVRPQAGLSIAGVVASRIFARMSTRQRHARRANAIDVRHVFVRRIVAGPDFPRRGRPSRAAGRSRQARPSALHCVGRVVGPRVSPQHPTPVAKTRPDDTGQCVRTGHEINARPPMRGRLPFKHGS